MRRPTSRSETGKTSFVTLLMLAGIAGVAYYVTVFGPYYMDNYSLKQVMREQANLAWRVGDDEQLRKQLLENSKNIGKHQETVEGNTQWVGGVGLLLDNIFLVRDKEAKKITIQVTYDREFELPIVNRRQVLHFSPVVDASLDAVNWKN